VLGDQIIVCEQVNRGKLLRGGRACDFPASRGPIPGRPATVCRRPGDPACRRHCRQGRLDKRGLVAEFRVSTKIERSCLQA